jgi:hypothetical protein
LFKPVTRAADADGIPVTHFMGLVRIIIVTPGFAKRYTRGFMRSPAFAG